MRIILELDDNLAQKLCDLEQDLGLGNRSATVRYCINLAHDKRNPAYATVKTTKRLPLTPQERVQRQIDREETEKQARQDIIYTKGKNFCDILGGTVVQNGNGLYGCVYNEYSMLNPHDVSMYERKVPLEFLSEDHVEKQFRYAPKEKILAKLTEQKEKKEQNN